MKHVMIDLETMDNSPTSAIIAIGAVTFGCVSRTDGEAVHVWEVDEKNTFYARVSLQSCIDKGLTVNGDTIAWWMKQEDAARAEFYKNEDTANPLPLALMDLSGWFTESNGRYPWGNGSDFDNAILNHAYRKIGYPAPWQFWNARDLRTLKMLAPEIKVAEFATNGVKHTALADAVVQAKQSCAILNKLSYKE